MHSKSSAVDLVGCGLTSHFTFHVQRSGQAQPYTRSTCMYVVCNGSGQRCVHGKAQIYKAIKNWWQKWGGLGWSCSEGLPSKAMIHSSIFNKKPWTNGRSLCAFGLTDGTGILGGDERALVACALLCIVFPSLTIRSTCTFSLQLIIYLEKICTFWFVLN